MIEMQILLLNDHFQNSFSFYQPLFVFLVFVFDLGFLLCLRMLQSNLERKMTIIISGVIEHQMKPSLQNQDIKSRHQLRSI